MANTSTVPKFVRVANFMTMNLLRAGVKLKGFGVPMYLVTIRGRKSGQPRTTPLSVIEFDGKRYVFTPYGVVDWVRNIRAAGEATITRGRRAEVIRATELPTSEASLVLRRFIESGNPFGRNFGLTAASSPEDFERVASAHPVFQLQSSGASNA